MFALGRVENGVVVLNAGVHLPEGQQVAVLPCGETGGQVGRLLPHSVLDIPPVSLGAALKPLISDDDLLGEMLEDRS